jgi:hypothetical protein
MSEHAKELLSCRVPTAVQREASAQTHASNSALRGGSEQWQYGPFPNKLCCRGLSRRAVG